MQSGLCHGRGLARTASQFSTTFTNNTEPPFCRTLFSCIVYTDGDQCCCLSGVCVSPLWACLPSETGFCPPPPARTENTCQPCRYGSRQDYLPYRHGRPGGRRLRALVTISRPLVPDGRIQGRWTQKWPSKISCGLESGPTPNLLIAA